MPDSPYKQRILYDALGPFFDGMNSGADPETLPRTQAAYLQNCTVRNDFARPRAAYRRMTLDFGGDSVVEQNFTKALWQGGCYYKPDAGTEALMASIAGRLFKSVITGTTATISDVSIPSDIDSADFSIAWLWQAENFVIRNDGVARPVFFDGNTSRRSGAGDNISTIATANYTAAAIGSAANATLAAAYTGPLNALVTITVGGVAYLFQVISSVSGTQIRLRNFTDTAGGTISAGTSLYWKPSALGLTASPLGFFTVSSNQDVIDFDVTAPPNVFNLTPGQGLMIPGTKNGVPFNGQWRITQVLTPFGPSDIRLRISPNFPISNPVQIGFTSGDTVRITGLSSPDQVIATTATSFTVPGVAQLVDVTLLNAYVGYTNIVLWIGEKQYVVDSVLTNASSPTVALVNLNAPTTAGYFVIGSSVDYARELPVGKMGAYWRGRNWIALPDGKSFIASDIRGGSSGTAAYRKRDASLRTYENNLLAGGGSFSVPSNAGDIQAIIGTAQLDAALGQGPLAIIATNIVFSCNAPSDRTAWATVADPIVSESVISSGGEGQNSTVINNSDPIMRAKEGIRSLKYARRDFNDYGNVPISREVQPTLDADDQSLLQYGSAVVFNNRLLLTAHPQNSSFGIYHDKLVVLNSDLLSSLKGKRPPVYDGVWTGLNVLQLISGKFEGIDRCFAFCLAEDLGSIELWEIMPTEGPLALTNDDGNPIVQDIQSAELNFGQEDPRNVECLRLLDGELTIDQMTEDVTFTVYYKPEQWPDWVQWRTWTEKFDPSEDPGYRPRLGLGEPSDRVYDNVNARPLREAYAFQFRIVISGNCRFKGARFKATTIPKPEFAPPNRDAV